MTKRPFRTTSKELAELAHWLAEAGVTTVVMEATGAYWKPVYYSLEGLSVHPSSAIGEREVRRITKLPVVRITVSLV